MDCFWNRTEGDEANKASAGKPDGMFGYGCQVEVLICRMEKGEGGTVDTQTEGRG